MPKLRVDVILNLAFENEQIDVFMNVAEKVSGINKEGEIQGFAKDNITFKKEEKEMFKDIFLDIGSGSGVGNIHWWGPKESIKEYSK